MNAFGFDVPSRGGVLCDEPYDYCHLSVNAFGFDVPSRGGVLCDEP